MSEMEHHIGTLTIVSRLENETLEEQCKRILNNVELSSYCNSYQEMIKDEYCQEYIIHNDVLYSIDFNMINPYGDIFNAYENSNGTINFEVQYYNGGCGFTEAVERALNSLKK